MARVTLILRAFFALSVGMLAAAGPAVGQTTVCGTLSADTVWTLAGSPYVVTCNVYVQGAGNPILTIEPGVEVRFRFNTAMWIGWSSTGGMQALGAPGQRIRFTSDQATPAAGDWDGIRFGSQVDPASRIVSADIEYVGGDVSYPGVFIQYNNAVGALDGVVFSNTLGHDVYLRNSSSLTATGCTLGSVSYQDATPQSDWVGNTFMNWGATMSVLSPKGAEAIGHGNTILPAPGAVTELIGGTIAEDISLSDGPGPYLVPNTLYVQAATGDPTLTLEPGVEMRFETGKALYVGYSSPGELITVGGGAGVVLTSVSATPAPGDWIGVVLGHYSTGVSILRNLQIEYAGGSGGWPGALDVDCAATLDGVTLVENDRHDLYLRAGADLDVANCRLSSLRYISDTPRASWSGNEFRNWGETVSRLSIHDVESFSHGNSFQPVPGARVELLGHIVSETASWGPDPGPYVPTNGIYVQSSTVDPTLTLEPGVELHMPADKGLYVGYNSPGRLVADGGTSPIVLTSSAPVPAAGDWIGVVLYYNSLAGTLLRNVQIEYAGGWSSYPGAVFAYYNDGATLENVSFANNDRHDIYLAQNANLVVTSSTLSSLSYQNDTVNASWNGNLFYDWGATTSIVSALGADEVSHGNLFLPLPDARLEILPGTLRQDASWSPAPGPYAIVGNLYVQDSINDPTLTLEPGVELRFGASIGLYAGYSTSGGLEAADAHLTSAATVPARGDWSGVQVGFYGHGAFSGVLFDYAQNALEVQRAMPLTDLRFFRSDVGLYLNLYNETATLTPITGLRFDDCDTAVRTWGAPVRILDSELVGNLWGIDNSLSTYETVDARDNWWGAADGPSGVAPGSGAAVTAGVLYDPFLTAPIDDCDGDGLSDTCEVSCGLPGGLCDRTGCGGESDNDGNGVPDSCDLATHVVLRMSADDMIWTEVPPALGYDLVSGDLIGLLDSGGDFSLWTTGCMADDYPLTSLPHGVDPNVGEGYFYLLRTEMPGGPESYDALDGNQVGFRDVEIAASGNACP